MAVLAAISPGAPYTGTGEGAAGVGAVTAVLAGVRRQALVDVLLAVVASEAGVVAGASVAVDEVDALAIVLTRVVLAVINVYLTLHSLIPCTALALAIEAGEVRCTGAAILTNNIEFDAEIDLVFTVASLVSTGAITPVFLWSRPLIYARSSVDAGQLPARLHLQLLTVLALVLVEAVAGVVAGGEGLPTGAPVHAGRLGALVQVLVTQPAGPARPAGAGVVADAVHAGAVLAPAGHTLVQVGLAQRA